MFLLAFVGMAVITAIVVLLAMGILDCLNVDKDIIMAVVVALILLSTWIFSLIARF